MKAREESKSEIRHRRDEFARTFGLVPTVFVLAVVVLLLWQPITAAPADGERVRAVKTAAVSLQTVTMTAVGVPATQPPREVRHWPTGVMDEPRAVQVETKDAAPSVIDDLSEDAPRGGAPGGVRTRANTCPADNVGVLSNGSTIVGSTIGSTDDFVAGCGSQPGGQDEIFEFTVSVRGVWGLDSCNFAACWDTTLEIREETGGGCPGDVVACDGDGCNVCYFESAVSAFLVPTSTYYLIVDGWSTFAYGDFTITAILIQAGCTTDADCDDGIFCNGPETCDTASGCLPSPGNPCSTYEGYSAPCDDDTDSCPKPDSCFTWIAGGDSGYFLPESQHCANLASWVFDDIQGSHHTTGVLDFYTTPIVARSTPAGASPLGTVFLVNQSLFDVEPGSCNPSTMIAGTQCTGAATVDPGGSPAHDLPCSGTMPNLPNNAGDFGVCEIDFFIAYRTTENGAGMGIAGAYPELGGLAATDEFGVRVIWFEDCPPTGSYGATYFGDDVNMPADIEAAVVCQKPGGRCCAPDGSCSLTSAADCAAAGGRFGFTGTINGTDGGCGGGGGDPCILPIPILHDTVPGPGNTQTGFGNDGMPPIPADFFGPGSDPFAGTMAFEGTPIDEEQYGSSSTLINRYGDPLQPADPEGAMGTIEVELVALSLRSIEPIVVTYNGGQDPEEWDVEVKLSDTPAGRGSLTATKTHCNGGTYFMTLPVNTKLTFTNAANPTEVRVLDAPLEGEPPIELTAQGAPWVHAIWDPDVQIEAPGDGTFVAGVRETPGCSGPGRQGQAVSYPGGIAIARAGSFEVPDGVVVQALSAKLGPVTFALKTPKRPTGSHEEVRTIGESSTDDRPYTVPGGPRDARPDGDTCSIATLLTDPLPIVVTGTTVGYTDDYDEICPFDAPGSPEVVYEYSPDVDRTVDISLCESDYDTKLYIYQKGHPGLVVACNDDCCTNAAGDPYRSRLLGVELTGGSTYYITVDGYGGEAGNYQLEITESIAALVCPPDSLFSQPPEVCGWNAGTSDAFPGYLRYESFSEITESICDLHWWGLNLFHDGVDWIECPEDPMPFEIKFYDDVAGAPGAEVCSYTVSAPRTFVADVGRNLYQYDVLLDPCCALTDGWVSIQGAGDPNCWFLWMSSGTGDDSNCFDDGSGGGLVCGVPDHDYDLSMCLTPPKQEVVPIPLINPKKETFHTVVPPPLPPPAGYVPPGEDCWKTGECGDTEFHFGDYPIPAGFFDTATSSNSWPFEDDVLFKGESPEGLPDTIVHRLDPMLFSTPLPDTVVTEIELVALDLISCSPIVVDYCCGPVTRWEVEVSLPCSGPAPDPGVLTVTKTHANGGVFDSILNVHAVFTFTRIDDPSDVRVFDTAVEGLGPIVLQSFGGPWVHDAGPGKESCGQNFAPGYEHVSAIPGRAACQAKCRGIRHSGTFLGYHTVRPPKCGGCPVACCDPEAGICEDLNEDSCPVEYRVGLFSNCADLDFDGIADVLESNDCCGPRDACATGTHPNNSDTDGDGVLDGDELTNGSDACDPCDPNPASPTCDGLYGSDCNGNAILDSCDIAAGTSADCTSNGIPDECEPDCDNDGCADACEIACGSQQDANDNGIPDDCEIESPLPEDSLGEACTSDANCQGTSFCLGGRCYVHKNRYISIQPNNPGQLVKLKVTLTVSLPHPGLVGNSWWVQAPDPVIPGLRPKPLLGPGECVAVLGLEATAADIDWDAAGCTTLHITGCPIEPTSEYEVQAVAGGNASAAVMIPTAPLPTNGRFWCDVAGVNPGAGWDPPQGSTNFNDVFAILQTFQAGQVVTPTATALHLTWADVEGGNNNTVVNIADVQVCILAWKQTVAGGVYPFGPAGPDGRCP